MAPVKRRPPARSNHKKTRRRKPNISEVVYKFLSAASGVKESGGLSEGFNRRCRFCNRLKPDRGEVSDALDSQTSKNMANKRKGSTRNSKLHRVKRRGTAKEPTLSSCMHKTSGGEGIKKMKRYIQKALDFGVESGYLIPKDAAYRVLRVSSALMNDANYMTGARKSTSPVGLKSIRQTPIRFEDYEVQDARRRRRSRRRRRRRSRSGSRRRRKSGRRRSRRRGRRRSRSGNVSEVVEVNDEYDYNNNEPEKRSTTENANRGGEENVRTNQSDTEKVVNKNRDDEEASDLSVDEDETDEDEEKKRDDNSKS